MFRIFANLAAVAFAVAPRYHDDAARVRANAAGGVSGNDGDFVESELWIDGGVRFAFGALLLLFLAAEQVRERGEDRKRHDGGWGSTHLVGVKYSLGCCTKPDFCCL